MEHVLMILLVNEGEIIKRWRSGEAKVFVVFQTY